MNWAARIFVLIALLLCSAAQAQMRVASLDYCADQYLLALADDEQIAAVSWMARGEYSYHAQRAAHHPIIQASAEELLLLKPDLVIRSWGGGYRAVEMLQRFNIPLLQLDYTASFQSVRENLTRAGEALGQQSRARQLREDFDARLARVIRRSNAIAPENRLRALYITPGGVTAREGTYIDEILRAAGFINHAAQTNKSGWHYFDLEDIVVNPPDVIVAGFYDLASYRANNWALARHQAMRDMLAKRPTVELSSASIACPAWFIIDAIEAMHDSLLPTQAAARQP